MKVNFGKPLVDLEGIEIPGTTLGKQIASIIISQDKGDVLKFWDWAKKMHAGEAIDLDRSDKQVLRDFVKASGASILVKGQFEEVLVASESEPEPSDPPFPPKDPLKP